MVLENIYRLHKSGHVSVFVSGDGFKAEQTVDSPIDRQISKEEYEKLVSDKKGLRDKSLAEVSVRGVENSKRRIAALVKLGLTEEEAKLI